MEKEYFSTSSKEKKVWPRLLTSPGQRVTKLKALNTPQTGGTTTPDDEVVDEAEAEGVLGRGLMITRSTKMSRKRMK